MKFIVCAALAASSLLLAVPASAQDRDHRDPAMQQDRHDGDRHDMDRGRDHGRGMGHHRHRMCTMRHHHRVCRWG